MGSPRFTSSPGSLTVYRRCCRGLGSRVGGARSAKRSRAKPSPAGLSITHEVRRKFHCRRALALLVERAALATFGPCRVTAERRAPLRRETRGNRTRSSGSGPHFAERTGTREQRGWAIMLHAKVSSDVRGRGRATHGDRPGPAPACPAYASGGGVGANNFRTSFQSTTKRKQKVHKLCIFPQRQGINLGRDPLWRFARRVSSRAAEGRPLREGHRRSSWFGKSRCLPSTWRSSCSSSERGTS